MDEYKYKYKSPPVGPNSHLTDEELSQKLTLTSTVFTCNCGDHCDDYPSFYDSDDKDDYLYPSAIKVLFYLQVTGHVGKDDSDNDTTSRTHHVPSVR